MKQFVKPFRVGRKQKRAVLDANGLEVVVFRQGHEDMAEKYCKAANRDTYQEFLDWCKKTNRNADVFGISIKDFCKYLDNQ